MNRANRYGYAQERIADIDTRSWPADELTVLQQVLEDDFDIVHFRNQTLPYRGPNSVFDGLDLPLLHGAGRKVVYPFTGYELRVKLIEMELNQFTPLHFGFEPNLHDNDQKRCMDFTAPYINTFVVQDPEMQSYLPPRGSFHER
jgi:hypothetical protein